MAINDIFRFKPFTVIATVTTFLKISCHKNFLLNFHLIVKHVSAILDSFRFLSQKRHLFMSN